MLVALRCGVLRAWSICVHTSTGYFQSNFQLTLSERGSTKEEAAYIKLMDFLDNCEGTIDS